MRAWQYTRGDTGPQLVEVERPALAANEIAVEVRAASVNPADAVVVGGEAHDPFGLPDTVGIG